MTSPLLSEQSAHSVASDATHFREPVVGVLGRAVLGDRPQPDVLAEFTRASEVREAAAQGSLTVWLWPGAVAETPLMDSRAVFPRS